MTSSKITTVASAQKIINETSKLLEEMGLPPVLMVVDNGQIHTASFGDVLVRIGAIATVQELELKKIKAI